MVKFGEKMLVKTAINTVKYDRVIFVDKNLEGKSWGARSYRLPKEVLMRDYSDNVCQQYIVQDNEEFYKYSLIIWVEPTDWHVVNTI